MQEQVKEELKLFYSPLLCAWRESTRRDSFPACEIYQNVSRETFLSDRDLKSYKANDSGLSQVCKIGRFFGVIGIGRHWRHEDLIRCRALPSVRCTDPQATARASSVATARPA